MGNTLGEELRVKLLGNPAAFVGEEPIRGFVSVKAQALLFYLAATGETHRRDALASLLWSDVPDAAARKNLRDVLSNLRRLIGPFLIITRQEVGLNPDAPTYIDSWVLRGTLSAVHNMRTGSPANTLQSLAEFADPRMGEFLDGFYAPDAPLFEEWMLAERARLQWELGNALEKLTEYSLASGDYAEAEAYARRQLELDSYRETAHRQLMTALALSDRRAEAVSHYEGMADLLYSELGLEPAQKTQKLVAQIQAGETITPAIAGIPQVPPDNLPEALTPFIGRESELAIIAAQLEEENCRLLTLHGPGGAGKTRLALEFARGQRGQYSDGIFFVPLASLASAENLVFAIAGAVGLQIRPGREARQQLLRFLQNRQMLLLLDNFEHLKEGTPLLVDMLKAAPGLTILVTSRERLHLAAESLFEVYGLRTDSGDGRGASRSAPTEVPEAVLMFETYARRVRPEFEPDENERTAVADLCRLVEGMPLAIELAAAWVLTLSPVEILQQITASSSLLETEYADIPSRLRSVRASFNYSWELLSEEEQQALMKLAVFRGGCTRESAQAVAGATAEILAALVYKSMLTCDPADGRYYVHELVRQLANEHLEDSEQEAAVKRKHAHYFLAYALRAYDMVEREGNLDDYLRRIAPELDNGRIALRRSLAEGDTETALQLATAQARYLGEYGMAEEALSLLNETLSADNECIPPVIRAEAYLRMSEIWWITRGDRKSMSEFARNGLELYQLAGDEYGVARALFECGHAYFGWDWEKSRANLIQSIAAYERTGVEPVYPLIQLCRLEMWTGNLGEARTLINKRYALNEKYPSNYMLRKIDSDMAKIHYYRGELDEAQALAEKSLRHARMHGPEAEMAFPLEILVSIAMDRRQVNRARALIRERLSVCVESNWIYAAVFCLDQVAEWLFLSGHPYQAAYWAGCLERARIWGNRPIEPVNLQHYTRLVSEVREVLGEAVYTTAWEEGYAVPVEDALPLALQVMKQTLPESGGCKKLSAREKPSEVQ